MRQEQSVCAHPFCNPEFKRKPLETSKDSYCIFHAKAEEKDKKGFKEALRNYINEIKANDWDYDFGGFIFVAEIDFKEHFGVTVFRNAGFLGAEFHGLADFLGAQFHGKAGFEWAQFHGNTSFFGAQFHGNADFLGAQFHGNATFADAEFHQDATFWRAQFRARSASISPKLIKKKTSFAGAILENISLTPLNLDRNASLDLEGAWLRNTDIRRQDIEGYIIQEQDKNFSKAKEIYLLLKNNFHTFGRYDDESWAFKKEKDMERKSYFHFRKFYLEGELGKASYRKAHQKYYSPRVWWFYTKYPLRWFGSVVLNMVYGYGERPFRIFGWCAALIIFCSICYWMYQGASEVVGQQTVPLKGYLNYLYFSIVTFTTLGYGDYRPIGGIKALASIEALLGIFFIALFIFAFARRTGGR